MIGNLKDLTINRDGTQNITITVKADFREAFDELAAKEVEVTIKPYSEHRRLDINARAWVLIDQIAEKTGIKKYDVYREAIKDIGGVSDVICVKDIAVDTLCRNWRDRGEGWMAITSPSKLPGCTNVTLYYGSSTYTKAQMSRLVDILVQDAEQIGIPTMTPAEYEKLLDQWGRKIEKKREKADEKR